METRIAPWGGATARSHQHAAMLFQIYGHLVFATKDRQRWLDGTIRERVYAYLTGTLRNLSCADVHIGGPDDHVHALFLLPKVTVPTKLIQEIKQKSSKHVKTYKAQPHSPGIADMHYFP
jgi:REP element-mobilizing transposase RayT